MLFPIEFDRAVGSAAASWNLARVTADSELTEERILVS